MDHPVSRVLALLELLQDHPGLTAPELAARLDVDERTVRRYTARLAALGIPVRADRGRYGGYRLLPGYRLPPLMLTADEAASVVLGLLAGRSTGLTVGERAAGTALAKIQRVLPPALRERIDAVEETLGLSAAPAAGPSPAAAALFTLADAARRRRRVLLVYRDREDRPSEREFDPYGLVFHSGRWYTTGLDHRSGEERTFRLDRIVRAEPREAGFEPPDDVDPVRRVVESLAAAPWTHRVEVELGMTLAEARVRLPCAHHQLGEVPQRPGHLVPLRRLGVRRERALTGGVGRLPAIGVGEREGGLAGDHGVRRLVLPARDGVGEAQVLLGRVAVLLQHEQSAREVEPDLGHQPLVQLRGGGVEQHRLQHGHRVRRPAAAAQQVGQLQPHLGGLLSRGPALAVEARGGLRQGPDRRAVVAGLRARVAEHHVRRRERVGVVTPAGGLGQRPVEHVDGLGRFAALQQHLAEQAEHPRCLPGQFGGIQLGHDLAEFGRSLGHPALPGGGVGGVLARGGRPAGRAERGALGPVGADGLLEPGDGLGRRLGQGGDQVVVRGEGPALEDDQVVVVAHAARGAQLPCTDECFVERGPVGGQALDLAELDDEGAGAHHEGLADQLLLLEQVGGGE
ncbi:YafY family protein [Kitasatospora sp. NPDC093558]|uniref:helix-turn-helix transcriptional regulator n=1 Tax=Kitasatospora sp. NPDC093558 TaxID=3155201 RepID=UPI0034226CD3